MLICPKYALNKAMNNNFAIPSVNFIDSITLCSYLETVKELNLPLILAIAQSHLEYIDFDEAVMLAKHYIKKYNVNVILHLDHGKDFELIKKQ